MTTATTPKQTLPKAAAAILTMPGIESLERGPDGWCCHLAYGWTTEALSGGGTIIDSNLATIRSYVRGAYRMTTATTPKLTTLTTPELVTLQLTAEEAVTVFAALQRANTICREKELAALNLHESQQAGPVTRAEAWETYRKWERHENETVQVIDLLRSTGIELGFSAFTRF